MHLPRSQPAPTIAPSTRDADDASTRARPTDRSGGACSSPTSDRSSLVAALASVTGHLGFAFSPNSEWSCKWVQDALNGQELLGPSRRSVRGDHQNQSGDDMASSGRRPVGCRRLRRRPWPAPERAARIAVEAGPHGRPKLMPLGSVWAMRIVTENHPVWC